jgi:AraC-like DNA-binding protein
MFARAHERMTDAVRADASRFAAAMTLHATHQASACEEAAADLLRRVVFTYSKMGAGARGVPEDARPSDYRIRRALPLIDAQALESPRIGEIAKQVGLSRSRFFEQFRRCVGVSPQHYVNVVRMSAATEWLSMTDRPLVALAEELGFCAQSNFTRFFTQHTGVSPSEFRRQTRQFEPPAGADLIRGRVTETRMVA